MLWRRFWFLRFRSQGILIRIFSMKSLNPYFIFWNWCVIHTSYSFHSSSFSSLNKVFNSSCLWSIKISFSVLFSAGETIHTFGLNSNVFLKFLNFIHKSSYVMKTWCYIVKIWAQPIIVITQLHKHFLLLVKQSLHLIRLSFSIQPLHNMKRFILLSYLDQLGVPKLRHLIDRLGNMRSLFFNQHCYPVPLRSPLKHDIDLLSVTFTRQSFLKLIIINFERKLFLKPCDHFIDV